MKKIFSTLTFLGILAIAATAIADVNGVDGTITITNAAAGPDMNAVAISAKSFVTYSGTAGAGGYAAAACGSGTVMSVTSASSSADPNIALFFAVRDSANPACTPDNNVYQTPVGAAPTAVLVAGQANVDFTADYSVRGSGSATVAAAE